MKYEISGPHYMSGELHWIVWEHKDGCIPQTLSIHSTKDDATASVSAEEKYQKNAAFIRKIANQRKSDEVDNVDGHDWIGGFDAVVDDARSLNTK